MLGSNSTRDENPGTKTDNCQRWSRFLSALFNRENLLALAIALLLIAIYILTAADSPLWVYQGF